MTDLRPWQLFSSQLADKPVIIPPAVGCLLKHFLVLPVTLSIIGMGALTLRRTDRFQIANLYETNWNWTADYSIIRLMQNLG